MKMLPPTINFEKECEVDVFYLSMPGRYASRELGSHYDETVLGQVPCKIAADRQRPSSRHKEWEKHLSGKSNRRIDINLSFTALFNQCQLITSSVFVAWFYRPPKKEYNLINDKNENELKRFLRTDIRKSPDVAEIDRKANDGKKKFSFFCPCFTFL